MRAIAKSIPAPFTVLQLTLPWYTETSTPFTTEPVAQTLASSASPKGSSPSAPAPQPASSATRGKSESDRAARAAKRREAKGRTVGMAGALAKGVPRWKGPNSLWFVAHQAW